MDTLRDEIRKPVDEIEEREAAELKARQNRLTTIEILKIDTKALAAPIYYQDSIQELKQLAVFDWGDFQFKAETLIAETLQILEERLTAAKKYEADQAELAQLKKEKEERERKDHEEKIAREAAEKERKESEEREKRIAEEKRVAEAKAIVAERKAQIMALGLVQDIASGCWILPNVKKFVKIFPSELFAKDAATWEGAFKNVAFDIQAAIQEQKQLDEEAKIAAEKKAKEEAEKAVQAAIEAEKERIRQEAELVRKETEKREANKKHRAKINNAAVLDFACHVMNDKGVSILDEETSKRIVEVIARGLISNVQINY